MSEHSTSVNACLIQLARTADFPCVTTPLTLLATREAMRTGAHNPTPDQRSNFEEPDELREETNLT
jgi:hypothetical protein